MDDLTNPGAYPSGIPRMGRRFLVSMPGLPVLKKRKQAKAGQEEVDVGVIRPR
jgi:hypothetical protein